MKASRRIKKCATTSMARFKSGKTGRIIEAESPLERDLFRLFEFEPNVVDYVQQPAPIEYEGADGKMHSYTPDARAKFRVPDPTAPNGLLIEVKTKRWLEKNRQTNEAAWDGADRWASHNGIAFHVYDEDAIRTPRAENAFQLLPYRLVDGDGREASFFHSALERGPSSIGDLLRQAETCGYACIEAGPVLYGLIARFEVLVEMDEPVTLDSIVTLPEEGAH